jgi:hypothetical protein
MVPLGFIGSLLNHIWISRVYAYAQDPDNYIPSTDKKQQCSRSPLK